MAPPCTPTGIIMVGLNVLVLVTAPVRTLVQVTAVIICIKVLAASTRWLLI